MRKNKKVRRYYQYHSVLFHPCTRRVAVVVVFIVAAHVPDEDYPRPSAFTLRSPPRYVLEKAASKHRLLRGTLSFRSSRFTLSLLERETKRSHGTPSLYHLAYGRPGQVVTMALLRKEFTRAQHRSNTRRVCEYQLFFHSVLCDGISCLDQRSSFTLSSTSSKMLLSQFSRNRHSAHFQRNKLLYYLERCPFIECVG